MATRAFSPLKPRLSLYPPKQSCSMCRNMNKDRLFLIKLSHALLFQGTSVQCMTGPWFIYTVLKFWGLKWLNLENRLHETSRQAAGHPSSATLTGCPRGAKEDFCVSPVQKQESIFTAETASISRDPSNMGCTMLIAPFAQQLFSRWREDAIFVSFHSLPAFPSHHFTFAALFPPGRSFKVGRKIDRLIWKERFPKASAPVPHHPPIQTALSTSSQSGCSLQTGSHWASSGPRVSTLLITKKEEKILQLI